MVVEDVKQMYDVHKSFSRNILEINFRKRHSKGSILTDKEEIQIMLDDVNAKKELTFCACFL